MTTQLSKRAWGANFISGAYAVAVALLFILLLRSMAVQITPPPALLNEAYPDVSTESSCQAEGGRWIITPPRALKGEVRPAPVTDENVPVGYCQGPLKFERERGQQEENSRQTSLFVFAIGGALAVIGGATLKGAKAIPAGLLMGGIVSFFVAGTHLWLLVPGIGRLITIAVLFAFLVGAGWYIFKEKQVL